MKDTALTLVEAVVDKVHYTLGLISGFGSLYEAAKYIFGSHPNKPFWHYILAVDWFVGVAVVYTAIAFFIGAAVSLILSSILFRAKDDPRQKQFSASAGTPVIILATIVGLIVAITYRSGPVIYSFGDIPAIILFRLVGFAAIAWSLLFFIGLYETAVRHRTPVR